MDLFSRIRDFIAGVPEAVHGWLGELCNEHDGETTWLGNCSGDAADVTMLFESLIKVVLVVGGLLLIVQFVTLMVRSRRIFVFSGITNALGDTGFDLAVEHASKLARTRLLSEINQVLRMARGMVVDKDDGDDSTPPWQLARHRQFSLSPPEPPIESISASAASQLSSSLSAVAPESVRPLIPLINSLFAPRVTQVKGFIECVGDPPSGLRLTLEALELNSSDAPATCTIWADGGRSLSVPDVWHTLPTRPQTANPAIQIGSADAFLAPAPLSLDDASMAATTAGPVSSGDLTSPVLLGVMRSLMGPAAWWIAVEAWRLQLTASGRRSLRTWLRKMPRAEIHHLCGHLYWAAARNTEFPAHTNFFLNAADQEFQHAIDASQERQPWPYVYRARLQEWAAMQASDDSDVRDARLCEAEALLQRAMPRIGRDPVKLLRNEVGIARMRLRRRQISPELVAAARDLLEEAYGHVRRGERGAYCTILLYNLGGAYVLLDAYGGHDESADRARRLLGYALARCLSDDHCNLTIDRARRATRRRLRRDPRWEDKPVSYEQTWELVMSGKGIYEPIARTAEQKAALLRFRMKLDAAYDDNSTLPCLPFAKFAAIVDRLMDDAGWTTAAREPASVIQTSGVSATVDAPYHLSPSQSQ